MRATNIEAIVSPEALSAVAGGSTKNPIVAIKGKASGGNPNKETINISPTKPPPGAPDNTKAAKIETTTDRKDRKSTRLNSSHANISYAVFCLKKKTRTQ